MPEDTLSIGLDVDQSGLQRLREARGRFRRFDAIAQDELELGLGEVGEALLDALKHEFEPHDRGPVDPTDPMRVERTLDTFRLEGEGFERRAVMGGGAPFIEYGTTDHWVEPIFAEVLHWIDPETGEDRFSKGHEVSGIPSDDFVGRAVEDVDLEFEMRRLALRVGQRITREGPYGLRITPVEEP